MRDRFYAPARLSLVMAASMFGWICLMASTAKAEKPVDLSGYVAARSVDCFNPACHDHGPEYFLVDDESGDWVPLKGYDKQLQGIHPLQKVKIKGLRHRKSVKTTSGIMSKKPSQMADGSTEEIEIQQFEMLPMTEQAVEQNPIAANGANSLKMISTLLVFVSTNTNGCMTSETNARKLLFDNPKNANLGMQAITKGRYGLQLGNGTGAPNDHIINLHLDLNSADCTSAFIEWQATLKLFQPVANGGMGLDRLAWDRILIFAPGGIQDSGFTAYAYYPYGPFFVSGMVSVYGGSYGNNRMNGYLHELGHNFGFAHSSKGGSEYGDRTCVMGVSNSATTTETYNVCKLMSLDWLDAFPDAKVGVTTDKTIDLYPLSSDPNVGPIAVSFPGTVYYAAYHRNDLPYGALSQASDVDKVFVYTSNGIFYKSNQVASIAPGGVVGAYGSPGIIHFERYGPNNSYATVSFDMDDGNTKPVANTQSVYASADTPIAITLSGSDADHDPLIFTNVTNPTKGVLSGTAPNLTYTPNTGQLGTDSFVFKVHDGKISSFATVSISINVVPVANNQSVRVFLNTPEPITLNATDPNPQILAYSIVSSPSHGTLSGTLPNLIYTPNSNYFGTDSFTFRANDGLANSNTATVSINVLSSPNSAPVVYAGLDQIVTLSPNSPWTPANIATSAWYDASDASTITASAGVVSQWRDKSGNNRHVAQATGSRQPVYTNSGVNGRGTITFDGSDDTLSRTPVVSTKTTNTSVFIVSQPSSASVKGATFKNGDSYGGGIGYGTGNFDTLGNRFIYLRETYAWHDSGINYGTNANIVSSITSASSIKNYLNSTLVQTVNALVGTPSGTTSIGGYGTRCFSGSVVEVIMIDSELSTSDRQRVEGYLAHKWGLIASLPSDHPYKADAPIVAATTVSNLDGTISDGNGDPLTTAWTLVSGPAPVSFANASSVDTTATFTTAGNYTLRLTADDTRAQSQDDVVIIVDPAPSVTYLQWSGGSFVHPFTQTGLSQNQDGDSMTNLQEFAFGTDPTKSDSSALAIDGSMNGLPVPVDSGGGAFDLYFVRRKDHGTSGSVSYTVQFSSDLGTFHDNTAPLTRVAGSLANPNYEVVKVDYPSDRTFGRIKVTPVP